MIEENLPLIPDLPVYAEDLDKIKKKQQVNILQDQMLDLMNDRKATLSQIQRETKIPWGTLQGWHDGSVYVQKADKNLLALAKFFNVTIDYLCFGVGDDTPYYEKFDNESA